MPSHAARGRIHPTRSAAAGRPVDMWAAMPCPVAAAQVSLVARMSRANRLTVSNQEKWPSSNGPIRTGLLHAHK